MSVKSDRTPALRAMLPAEHLSVAPYSRYLFRLDRRWPRELTLGVWNWDVDRLMEPWFNDNLFASQVQPWSLL